MPDTKTTTKQASGKPAKNVWSDEEKAAMQESASERKAAGSAPGGGAGRGRAEVLAKIAEMPEPDRSMAQRIHEIVTTSAPTLVPRTYYGMPAYGRDGKTICFFKPASKFKERNSTFGFEQHAQARRRRHVAGRVQRREAEPGGRAAHRRAREESRGLSAGPRLGRHRGPGRPREQPPQRQPRHPEAAPHGVHGRLGLGQELARLPDDRRRVPAADQRDLQRVRPGVHGDAGAPGRRLAGGPDDRDHRRPGADGRERPLDRRDRDRRQRAAADGVQPASASRTSAGPRPSRSTSPRSAARGRSRWSAVRAQTESGSSASSAACAPGARAWAGRRRRLSELYDETKSLKEGAIRVPGYS